MCAPWVLHFFPGMTMDRFEAGDWTVSLYLGMWDMAKDMAGSVSG